MAHQQPGGHIRCPRCGGVFLDRGEMERLIQGEGGYYSGHGGRPEGFLGGIFGGGHHGERRGGHH